MIRSFIQNIALPKNVGSKLNSFKNIRPVSTAVSAEHNKDEYNYVKLQGTIVSNVRVLPNGTKSLIVRTTQNNNAYCNHHINAVSNEPMSQGNRVYVFGSLSSKPFSLDDGRLRYSIIIKSKYLRLRANEHNTHSKSKDVNNVKILAKVSTDIHHANNHTLFTLVSSHTPKGEGRIPGLSLTEFHTVIVYEKTVRELTENMKKFDRVLVEGIIRYMPYKNASGKTQHGGFIEAQNIEVVSIDKT